MSRHKPYAADHNSKICANPIFLCLLIAASTQAAHFKFDSQTLTVPEGFTVERVAAQPLVDRPVSASFDEQGRLYVTDSSGSNDKVQKQLEEKPHRVVRLADNNGDGKFDQSTVFADKMMFPEGCLWFEGSLYVSAPPSIWKLTDTDDDGVADLREEWHQGKTLTGCANDLHGPQLGPDGFLYWGKGAFAEQTYVLPTGRTLKTRASHIFRKRPDGSGFESVLTGGMDNPVAVGFSETGERFLVGTFFLRPQAGMRDGIIHAIYGGIYGKPNDVLEGHPRTGDLMPIMTHMGPAAPCSIIRYLSPGFGASFQNNLFVCAFNLNKVTRHILEYDGATFRTRDSDFLTSSNPDFHPTDVLEDADGTLLVLDTGGWYKICCPTSQLWKPDVLGAIYRIRKVGAPDVTDPRGSAVRWQRATDTELTTLLGDSRPAVQQRAIQELARRGDPAIPEVMQLIESASKQLPSNSVRLSRASPPVHARLNAIWALCRMDAPSARDATRQALNDPDPVVQNAALNSISLWRDADALPQLKTFLTHESPHLRRAAAEAIGRIGNPIAIPDLLVAAATAHDRVLEHSITFALIEMDQPEATQPGLRAHAPRTQRAALMALDQMESANLDAQTVLQFLSAQEPELRNAALWILTQHPDWGGSLAGFLQGQLETPNLPEQTRAELEVQLATFAEHEAVQRLLASSLQQSETPSELKVLILNAMAKASVTTPPDRWSTAIARSLENRDSDLVRAAIAAAGALIKSKNGSPELSAPLIAVAHNDSHPRDIRLNALAALPSGYSLSPALFQFLRENLDASQPLTIRATASDLITRATLAPDQLSGLAEIIKSSGTWELTKLLPVLAQARDENAAAAFIKALENSPGFAALHPDLFKARLTNLPDKAQALAKPLLSKLTSQEMHQAARLDEMLQSLPPGDVRRGQALFNSAQTACSACHSIGYLGGNVGPDLTRIGQIRTERDLLEAVVFPSASFVRSYEPWTVITMDGTEYSGVLRKDSAEEIILAAGPGYEVKISRSEIADMRPGSVSVMPQGLDEQLSKSDLADLIAFLRATRW